MIKTCFIGIVIKNGTLKLQIRADSIYESVVFLRRII